jgi:glycosyltransferase involved in cell wall biosynthesis
MARARYPGAEIWALAHEDLAQAARDDGADRVIEHRAVRLGILPFLRTLTFALRRQTFDAIVIPQMTPDPVGAANLYRLAWWIAAAEVLVVAHGEQPRAYSRAHMAGLAWRSTLPGVPEAWVTLALLARALVRRRLRSPVQSASGTRPRVLHVIDNFGMGGAQAQLAELLNHMPADQYDVEVLALSGASLFSRHRLARAAKIGWLDDRLRTSQRIIAVRDHCRTGRYDLVHTWLFGSNIVGVAAAGLADVPRIVTSVRSLNPGYYPSQLRWWHRIADALSSRIADVVTVNAAPLATDHARWARIPRQRVRVVHNGIDPAPLEEASIGAREWLRALLSLPRDCAVIGTVGRLAVEKDQATFVRAVARLVHDGVDVYAVVAGEGPLRDALGTLGAELGLGAERLRWLGARTDARRVIAGLDVFVLTSRIEGFPNALLEAALVGVPCVSSHVGGVVDVLGDTDNLFAAGDAAAAARLIESQLADDGSFGRARALRDRCRRLFTAREMVARWQDVYGS